MVLIVVALGIVIATPAGELLNESIAQGSFEDVFLSLIIITFLTVNIAAIMIIVWRKILGINGED